MTILRDAALAFPREVLVTAEIVERSKDGRLCFQAAGKRMLKGFDEPVLLYSAERRPAKTGESHESVSNDPLAVAAGIRGPRDL